MHRLFVPALVVCSPIAAQVFVVDAASGPGTHFTAIDTAVAAVPDGAVLLVRAGVYAPFVVAAKGLTIAGEPGASVQAATGAAITITQTSPAQRVIVRDLGIMAPPWQGGGSPGIVVDATQGAVALLRLATSSGNCGLGVANAAQLAVEACGPFSGGLGGTAMSFGGCNAVCIGCNAMGLGGGGAELTTGATVQFIACNVTGGPGSPSSLRSAIQTAAGSQLRLAAGSVTGIGLAAFAIPAIAISGQGTVLRDPGVAVSGTVITGGDSTLPLGWLTATGGPIGTMASATMNGPSGQLGALVVGVVGPPLAVPGIQNTIWLAPSAFVVMAAGVFGPPLGAAVPVPNDPLLHGTLFAWQGVTLDGSGAWTVTNPSLLAP